MTERRTDEPVATTAGDGAESVPSGNLFEQPALTALDPAEPEEREAIERLLESLDRAEGS